MDIARWEPFGGLVSLRDAMDRLVSESFIRPSSEAGQQSSSLAVDVRDEGDHFVISAPLPGMTPEDVEITVLGDMLRIRGERREEQQRGSEDQRWLVREQRYGSFERGLRLPSTVKADAAEAEFNNGILTIKLPKSEEAKERRIQIRGGQQPQDVPIETQTTSESQNQSSSGS